jgi:hypothetical protein
MPGVTPDTSHYDSVDDGATALEVHHKGNGGNHSYNNTRAASDKRL